MAIFKKKANDGDKIEEKDIVTKLVEDLNQKIEQTIYDKAILIPRYGFSIDIQVTKDEVKNDIRILQVVYIIKSDMLDEPIIEPILAQGASEETTIAMATNSFVGGLWNTLKQMFEKKNPIRISSHYLGQSNQFDMYAHSIVIFGTKEKKPTMLINLIKDVIPKYLGNKKYYWVRIFLARQKDKRTIEVRINGSVCAALSQFFTKYVDGWEDSDMFISEKQYALFVNTEEDTCPYTREHAMVCINKTIELMETCSSQEDYTNLKNTIEELAGNDCLAAEIRIFIPEIVARFVLGYREGDSLFLIEKDAENPVEFKKTQMRSYFYMQQAVIEYLNVKKPEKEKVMNIVANSVSFREMKKVLQENEDKKIEVKNLFVPGTSYKVALEDYKVW